MCPFGCHITSNRRKKKIYSAKALILRPVSTRRRRFSSRCVWSFRRNGPSASECLIQSYEIGGDGRLTLSQQILGRVQVRSDCSTVRKSESPALYCTFAN